MRPEVISAISGSHGGSVSGPPTTVDFNKLSGSLTERDVRALHPGLDWLCTADDPVNHGQFGQRVCDGPSSTIDGIPATRVDYLFRDGSLSFAIIEYSPGAFEALAKQMDAHYPRRAPATASSHDAIIALIAMMFRGDRTEWDTRDGVAVSSRGEQNVRGNVFVLWISRKELQRQTAKTGTAGI
jgi:hypothetical protein